MAKRHLPRGLDHRARNASRRPGVRAIVSTRVKSLTDNSTHGSLGCPPTPERAAPDTDRRELADTGDAVVGQQPETERRNPPPASTLDKPSAPGRAAPNAGRSGARQHTDTAGDLKMIKTPGTLPTTSPLSPPPTPAHSAGRGWKSRRLQ
jgi:hypothetical protein